MWMISDNDKGFGMLCGGYVHRSSSSAIVASPYWKIKLKQATGFVPRQTKRTRIKKLKKIKGEISVFSVSQKLDVVITCAIFLHRYSE